MRILCFFVAGIDYISDNRDVKYHLIYICHRALKARSGVSLRYLIVPWTSGPLDFRDPEGIIRGQDPDSSRPLAATFFDFFFYDF